MYRKIPGYWIESTPTEYRLNTADRVAELAKIQKGRRVKSVALIEFEGEGRVAAAAATKKE